MDEAELLSLCHSFCYGETDKQNRSISAPVPSGNSYRNLFIHAGHMRFFKLLYRLFLTEIHPKNLVSVKRRSMTIVLMHHREVPDLSW